jgi:hypothetical protein
MHIFLPLPQFFSLYLNPGWAKVHTLPLPVCACAVLIKSPFFDFHHHSFLFSMLEQVARPAVWNPGVWACVLKLLFFTDFVDDFNYIYSRHSVNSLFY